MAELKTKPTGASVEDYLASIADPRRATEARQVTAMMGRVTGEPPRMWGASIIGFGEYRYQNSKGKDLCWFLTGLAPRKQALTVYVMPGFDPWPDLMERIGPHRLGKSCLYISRLEKVDFSVLEDLLARSVALMRQRYGVA